MSATLHLIRRAGDRLAAEAARAEAAHAEGTIVVLLEEAVAEAPPAGLRAFALEADAHARDVRPQAEPLSDAALVELIVSAAKVVCW